MDPVERLHATLRRRETPETVAALVRDALAGEEDSRVARLLTEVIGASVAGSFGWSSMSVVFPEPAAADRQIAKAQELVGLFLHATLPDGNEAAMFD